MDTQGNIVFIMHKVMRRMVKIADIYCKLRICKVHKRNNKGKSILVNGNSNKQRGNLMCRFCNSNELIYDQMKRLYNSVCTFWV